MLGVAATPLAGVSATPLYGSFNTAVGDTALTTIRATAGENTGVGYTALEYLSTGSGNTAVGYEAMVGESATPLTGAGNNTAVGYQALQELYGTAANNTALGMQALQAWGPGIGSRNSAVGQSAFDATSGTGSSDTTAMGESSLNVSTGTSNTAIGVQTLYYATTADDNDAFGFNAMEGVAATPMTGDYNVAFGDSALLSLQAAAAANNTAVGYEAGDATTALTTGSSDVYIGYEAHGSAATNTNEIVIGASAVGEGLNTVTLGNASIGAIYAEKTTITGISDRRHKKDIEDSDLGLDFIEKLRPVRFRLTNGDETLNYGFVAQDVEQALPKSLQDLIENSEPGHGLDMIVRDRNKERTYRMAYDDLFAPIVKSIQQHQQEIQQHHQEIAADKADLKQQIAALTLRIASLKQQIADLTRVLPPKPYFGDEQAAPDKTPPQPAQVSEALTEPRARAADFYKLNLIGICVDRLKTPRASFNMPEFDSPPLLYPLWLAFAVGLAVALFSYLALHDYPIFLNCVGFLCPILLFLCLIVAARAYSAKARALLDSVYPVWLAAAVGLGMVLLWIVGIYDYLLFPGFIDHIEATVAAVSWLAIHGHPIWPNWETGDVYGMLYGPLLYLVIGVFQLIDPSIFMSKLPGLAALLGAVASLWSALRRKKTDGRPLCFWSRRF